MKRVGPKRALSTVLMALLLTLGLSSNVFGFLWCVIEPPIGPLHRIGAAAIGTVRYEVITKDFEETARFTFHGTCKGIPVQWKPNEAFVTTCTDVEAFAAASGEEMTQMLEGRLGFGDDLALEACYPASAGVVAFEFTTVNKTIVKTPMLWMAEVTVLGLAVSPRNNP